MKKIILSTLAIASLAMATEEIEIDTGWQLLGSSQAVSNMEVFNRSSIKTVWAYDKLTASWKVFSTDDAINELVDANNDISKLNNLASNQGFWINANSSDIIDLDSTVSPSSQTKHFARGLSDVALSDIAGKSFEIKTAYWSDNIGSYTLVFDDDGIGSVTNSDGDDVANAEVKLVDGELVFGDTKFKLLAKGADGIVFGKVNLDDDSDWREFVINDSIIFAVYSGTTLFDGTMADKLPYSIFEIDGDSWWYIYGTDYNITSYTDYDGSIHEDNDDEFTIDVNGSIVQSYDYNSTYTNEDNVTVIYGYTNSSSRKIVYEIEDYRIEQVKYSGYSWKNSISYYDDSDIDETTVVFLDNDNDTWQELFALSANRMWDFKYTEDGKIYCCDEDNYYESYIISEDGKTLITYDDDNNNGVVDDNEENYDRMVITKDADGNNIITSEWDDSYYTFTSNSKIIEYSEHLARPLKRKKAITIPRTMQEAMKARHERLLKNK